MLCILQMTAHYKAQGLTLCDALARLYAEYGYRSTRLLSRTFGGASGKAQMDGLIAGIRRAPFRQLAGEEVRSFCDYAKGIDGLPQSDVLCFSSENCKAVIRPSGTEPKLKLYFFAAGKNASGADEKLEKLISDVCGRLGL